MRSVIQNETEEGVDEENVKTIGFLRDCRRINVLLTRAKYMLLMVGNTTHLRSIDETWKELV